MSLKIRTRDTMIQAYSAEKNAKIVTLRRASFVRRNLVIGQRKPQPPSIRRLTTFRTRLQYTAFQLFSPCHTRSQRAVTSRKG